MIAYLAADLIWSSRLRGWIEQAGFNARPARSADALRTLLTQGELLALVCEAEAPDAESVIAAAAQANAQSDSRDTLIVAFGPHVEKDLLERCRALGAHHVLPRGAVESRLPAILAQLAADSASSA